MFFILYMMLSQPTPYIKINKLIFIFAQDIHKYTTKKITASRGLPKRGAKRLRQTAHAYDAVNTKKNQIKNIILDKHIYKIKR